MSFSKGWAVSVSVALSVGAFRNATARVYLGLATANLRRRQLSALRVTRHRALWSSDFPPPACAGSDSPPFQNRS